jgi:adenylate cyclase
MSDKKSRKWLKYSYTVVIFFASLLFAALMELLPWFSTLDRATEDYAFSIRGLRPPAPEVVVVSIDESSQKEMGTYPWPRWVHGFLLDKLREKGAKVAVFDVLFDREQGIDPQTGKNSDKEFAEAIHRFGKVVLGKDVSTTSDPQFSLQQMIEPLPIFTEAGAIAAFVTTPTDPDTRVRRSSWMVKGESTLATEALYQYTGQRIKEEGGRYFIGDYPVPPNTSPGDPSTFTIDYVGPTHTIPTRSYYQVIDGTIPPGFLKDKIVFVGADLAAENRTGGPATDRFPTPVDVEGVLMPGVEIHANALNTLLKRSFIVTAPLKVVWALLILFAVLTTFFCTALRPLPAGIATGIMIVVAAVAVLFIFMQYNYWLPSIKPIALIALIYSGNTLVQYRLASRERAQISKAFKHYVSAEVLGELMKNPENLGLSGREVEATVLFTDIAGFSKISEKITPQELTQMLNQYFELLTGVIMREGGMVNKFIGDAVMAIWGVPLDNPNHAIQACRASLQMQRAMLVMDPVKCRIGLNTGTMIAGNMGSKERFEYTVIGDAVNLASRLEGVNKLYHTDIMISEMTEEKVRGHFLLREVDMIRVVGKQKPVRIFELLDTVENKEAVEHQRWAEMIDSFNPGMEAFRNRQWEKAVSGFEHHADLFPEDFVGGIYLERCRTFLANPPVDDWDGIFQMETK